VISGVVPEAERRHGEIHDLPDQQGLMAKVTAFSHEVRDPAELPEVLERAYDVFDGGRPRPVHIQIPVDVLRSEANGLSFLTPGAGRRRPLAAQEGIEDAAAALASARSPLILLGGGARDAGPAALALARSLGAPVGLTINARGAIDHDDPLCLGSALAFPPVSDILREADAVVLAGAELSGLDLWGLDAPLELHGVIRIDIDADQLQRRYPPAVALHGDARATLEALAAAVEGRVEPGGAGTERRVAEALAAIEWPPAVADFAEVVAALDAALPRDRLVAGDSTKPAYAANHSLPMHEPRSWLMPIGYGCLGAALPMAIGAKLAAPDRPVVALAGDGGFLFTLQELATARDLGLTLPVIVYNNEGYGEIRDAMDEADIPHTGTEFAIHDVPAIARGFGCDAVRATSAAELETALAEAFAASGPTVIELRESPA
jgi:thiamine pyrophosphate-dependent acetolactate synthase large subunit-like protein